MEIVPGTTSDPIAQFGQQSANWILRSLEEVPPAARPDAVRSLFKSIDPALLSRVDNRATKLRSQGMPVNAALRSAIASSMSQGLLDEYKRLGRGQRPKAKSITGLASPAGQRAVVDSYNGKLQALGWFGGDIADAVSGAAKSAYRGGKGAVYGAGSKASSWGSQAASAIGKLACGVATSNVGQAGAGVAGGPAAAAGAQAAANICSGKPAAPTRPVAPVYTPPRPTMPNWVIPAAIGGAALAVILAVR